MNKRLKSIVSSIKFVPEHISEFDLGDFLYTDEVDILLHQSQLTYLLEVLELHNTNEIEGDIVECGVWKGSSAAILKSSISSIFPNKKLYLFDFFGKGVSLDFDKLTIKERALLQKVDGTKINLPTLENVKRQLRRFDLLDDSVHFIQGDIIETAEKTQIDKVSFLHLDLDFFYTTKFGLNHFYEKVSKGGVIVINDYNLQSLDCKRAVDEFVSQYKIKNQFIEVGSHFAYWIKS